MIHRKHRCWIVAEVLRAAAEGKKNPEMLSVRQGGRFLRIFVAVLWLQSNLKHNQTLNCKGQAEDGFEPI